MAAAESVFIGCNRQLEVLDYNYHTKELAYGANSLVALYRPFASGSKGVFRTLKLHKKDVTSVKWLPNSKDKVMISTSEDSTIAIWKDDELLQVLDQHQGSVTCLAVLNEKIFVSGDAEGHVIIWGQKDGTFDILHDFTVKFGFLPLSLSLEEVESSNYVLVIGGTNASLYIYSFTIGEDGLQNFAHCTTLQGHEDWIKAIAFKKETDSSWLIASGSQDRYIRLWKLKINNAIDTSEEDSSKLTLLSNKLHKFNSGETECAISFDAIIMGHDDWISSLRWHPDKIQLLSSSADTSIMMWEPDTVSGIWISTTRLGEISIKGASTATGASGGFWTASWIFEDDREYIFTNGKTGSLRLWGSSRDANTWEQLLTVTGSLKPVTDLAWSDKGEYLLATSLDQTTRLIASWKNGSDDSWHEFARPQIHGYDMMCISALSSTRFISGGDEKILRSFDLPKSVANMLAKLCDIKWESQDKMAESASLPVLGLSNKAEADDGNMQQDQGENEDDEEAPESNITANDILSSLNQPPLEDVLQRHTLFPEIEKLYGHGYEISTVATSYNRKVVASACRSNTVQHAAIRIFKTDDWQPLGAPLRSHNLTVTRLAFSRDDRFLVGVSRDRQVSLWKVDHDSFSLVKLLEKAHSRIVWDVTFCPLDFMGGACFLTVSRDKQIKMWQAQDNDVSSKSSLKVTDSVTACDCLAYTIEGKAVVAIGLENGSVDLYSVSENGEFLLLHSVQETDRALGRINRISFSNETKGDKVFFATAGEDSSVRIYSLDKSLLTV